jgi:hypothetical protein
MSATIVPGFRHSASKDARERVLAQSGLQTGLEAEEIEEA